ncbi:hypothetical protein B0T10DRAFT_545660 [Thelonectria olida]|uniref:Uncharacterized protein n=1 Tax=Thelonectria olida TaxID=1576542 RepID=A0A9P9AV85_9HYPO|nr:hypothetical protein B0T10DRAFT_545660 [Thelonectria olida]
MDFNYQTVGYFSSYPVAPHERQPDSYASPSAGASFMPLHPPGPPAANSSVQPQANHGQIPPLPINSEAGFQMAFPNSAPTTPFVFGNANPFELINPFSAGIPEVPDSSLTPFATLNPRLILAPQSFPVETCPPESCVSQAFPEHALQAYPAQTSPAQVVPSQAPTQDVPMAEWSAGPAVPQTPCPSPTAKRVSSQECSLTQTSGADITQSAPTRTFPAPTVIGATLPWTMVPAPRTIINLTADESNPSPNPAVHPVPVQRLSFHDTPVRAHVAQEAPKQAAQPSCQSPTSQPSTKKGMRRKKQLSHRTRIQPHRGVRGARRTQNRVDQPETPQPKPIPGKTTTARQPNATSHPDSKVNPSQGLLPQSQATQTVTCSSNNSSMLPLPISSQIVPQPLPTSAPAQPSVRIFEVEDFGFSETSSYGSLPIECFDSFLKAEQPKGHPLSAKLSLQDFYTKHWCPGRSLHHETNPWLVNFTKLTDYSVLCALGCISYVYMNDYNGDIDPEGGAEMLQPALDDLNTLLQKTAVPVKPGVEKEQQDRDKEKAINLLIMLSTLHVVSSKNKACQSEEPLWLTALRKAEALLDQTDDRGRFNSSAPPTPTSIRVSQTMLVAYPIIVYEMMTPTPAGYKFNASKELARFAWLHQASTAREVKTSHGACATSREVLKVLSSITRLAFFMKHEEDRGAGSQPNVCLLESAEILRNLLDMMVDYDFSKTKPPDTATITDPEEMKVETSRAWVLVAMIYLQCRLYRLHRLNPLVQRYFDELCFIIGRMPIDGACFTAEAPFFPAFILATLGGSDQHYRVAMNWLKNVAVKAIRSLTSDVSQNVRSLYATAQRTSQWVYARDLNIKPPYLETNWWDTFVRQLNERERHEGVAPCYIAW